VVLGTVNVRFPDRRHYYDRRVYTVHLTILCCDGESTWNARAHAYDGREGQEQPARPYTTILV